MWKDGKETAYLNEKGPWWIAVRVLTSDGAAAKDLPLRDGHFELRLPKALFEGNAESIVLNWTDFYR